jgi:hypothetical protein
MPVPDTFFLWFYYGLNDLGGWLIFLLVGFVAMVWLYYDSVSRRLPALGWRLGITLAALLILPAILYRFTVPLPGTEMAENVLPSPLADFGEPIFYLGVLGGVLPLVLAAGYYITYQGMTVCPQGHVYEAEIGDCPHPDHLSPQAPPPPVVESPRPTIWDGEETVPPQIAEPMEPMLPPKEFAQAWLVTEDGRKSYQLFLGETKIGRSRRNDIVLEGDRSVSRESAKVLEENGHFRLYSLSTTERYPRVNGLVVRERVLLEDDDEIEFGESTLLRFVSAR